MKKQKLEIMDQIQQAKDEAKKDLYQVVEDNLIVPNLIGDSPFTKGVLKSDDSDNIPHKNLKAYIQALE